MKLYTNETGAVSMRNAFYGYENCRLSFAAPYFSEAGPLLSLLSDGCELELLVTRSSATTPAALRKISAQSTAKVRWMPTGGFHSKLYIFDKSHALVGSANLTDNGFNKNREICVQIPAVDPAFGELKTLFRSYWDDDQSQPVSLSDLDRYEALFNDSLDTENSLDKRIREAFPPILADRRGVSLGLERKILNTRNSYRMFKEGFERLRHAYAESGITKNPDVPLRLEIDQFLSWLYETKRRDPSWDHATPELLSRYLSEWASVAWPFLMNEVRPRLDTLLSCFSSPIALDAKSPFQIADVLWACHSVNDRERHFPGGKKGFNQTFVAKNSDARVLREKFKYLLWGADDPFERIAKCIHSDRYKIHELGEKGIPELYGWVNTVEAPISNNRAEAAMHHLGFILPSG